MFVSVGAEGQLSECQSHGEDHEAAARKTAGPTGPTQTVQLAGYETVRCSLFILCCFAVTVVFDYLFMRLQRNSGCLPGGC